jgi:uncharacterized protein
MQTLERISVKERADTRVRGNGHDPDRRPRAPASGPAPRGPRSASAGDAFVTILVCLCLWTLLAAPILERDAEAGPVGARRTAALAILRPLASISESLRLSRVTGSVERALGRDPEAPAGGELALPDFRLPPEAFEPTPVLHTPAESPKSPDDTAPVTHGQERDPLAEPTETAGVRSPTRSNKLRVAVIGDSLSQGLGPAIERWMDPEMVRVLSLGRQSTGLSRQDYFNWDAGMRQIVEQFRPDLVFVMLGSNDAQAQISRTGAAIPVGSVDWVEGYRERASRLLRTATRAGTRVAWVGIPVVREHERWAFYRRVNDIYRQTVEAESLGTFVDTWRPFEAKDGSYTAFVRNERGELLEMRAPDGIHFTPTGYAFLGRMVIRAASRAFDLPAEAVTFRI